LTSATETWAKAEIEEALNDETYTGPVFFMYHQPLEDTVYGSTDSNWGNCSAGFDEWIKGQKRVINLTAHIHTSAYDPRSIWQKEGGITSVHSSILGGGQMSQTGCSTDGNTNLASYCQLIEIDENDVVRIYRLDLFKGTYIGEPWVIDVSEDGEQIYTDARIENSTGATFPEGSVITATATDSNTISVSFEANATKEEESQPGYQDDFVQSYLFEAINTESGAVVKTTKYLGDFWRTDSPSTTKTAKLTHLTRNTTYKINVYACNAFGAKGEPLTTTVTTSAEKSAEDRSMETRRLMNVAQGKTVTKHSALSASKGYPYSNLVDGANSKITITGLSSTTWIQVDLEHQYKIEGISLVMPTSTNVSNYGLQSGFNVNLMLQVSADGSKWTTVGKNGSEGTAYGSSFDVVPSADKTYRYVRITRSADYKYGGFAELKVYAYQDVTEVSRYKSTKADNIYSSSLSNSKVVNGSSESWDDAWVSEDTKSGNYHYVQVDLESSRNIGLIEMESRNNSSTLSQRSNWNIYGSNTELSNEDLVKGPSTILAEGSGYTKIFEIDSSATNYPAYYGTKACLSQPVNEAAAYRFLTFGRSGANLSTSLGEIRAFVLNPMVNSIVDNTNGTYTVYFSDVMDKETTEAGIKVLDGTNDSEVDATVALSADGFSAVVTPVGSASFYKIVVDEDVENQYGTGMINTVSEYTKPENTYADMSSSTKTDINVALNKPVTSANISFYSSYPAQWATDGMSQMLTTDQMVGAALGSAKAGAYIQVDLLRRYNLERIEFNARLDLADARKADYTNLKILASNDADFADYDVLDEIGAYDENKFPYSGMWTINLDGTKDYRYLRVTNGNTGNEISFGELKAFADFDAFKVTDASTTKATAPYAHETFDESYAIDGIKATASSNQYNFYILYPAGSGDSHHGKYAYLQLELDKAYHVGYAEVHPRLNEWGSQQASRHHFDFFGSNTELDEATGTTTKYLENAEGFTKLSRILGGTNYTAEELPFYHANEGVYKVTFDDSEAYKYIVRKNNSTYVGIQLSELELYTIAQKVNNVTVDGSRITVHFADELISTTVSDETIILTDADGNVIKHENVSVDDYSYSFDASGITEGEYTLTVSENVMNKYAVPMIADDETTIKIDAVTDATLSEGDAVATELKAETSYTFSAKLTNYDSEATSGTVYVALKKAGKLVMLGSGSYENIASGETGDITAVLTTGKDVENCYIEVYVWDGSMQPKAEGISYFKE